MGTTTTYVAQPIVDGDEAAALAAARAEAAQRLGGTDVTLVELSLRDGGAALATTWLRTLPEPVPSPAKARKGKT